MPYHDEEPAHGPAGAGLWWVLPALIAGGLVVIIVGAIL